MNEKNDTPEPQTWMEPKEIDYFFQEFLLSRDRLADEFPDWSLSIHSTCEDKKDGRLKTTAIACVHPKVQFVSEDVNRASLEITVSIGGVDSDRLYFERADVKWFEQPLIIERLQGLADLLKGEKPTANAENIERVLSELPILYDDARRIMSMLA